MEMGDRGAGNGALGQPAVKCGPVMLLPALMLLGACSTAADIVGLATGAAAGGASVNPAVGYAVAVGTAAAADVTFKWFTRRWHRTEQDAIAATAGDLAEGQTAAWRVRHDLPFGNEQGEVQVVRAFTTPLASCKDILFNVADDPPAAPAQYETTLCKNDHGWKWALAEPAVPRWGYLQ